MSTNLWEYGWVAYGVPIPGMSTEVIGVLLGKTDGSKIVCGGDWVKP